MPDGESLAAFGANQEVMISLPRHVLGSKLWVLPDEPDARTLARGGFVGLWGALSRILRCLLAVLILGSRLRCTVMLAIRVYRMSVYIRCLVSQ